MFDLLANFAFLGGVLWVLLFPVLFCAWVWSELRRNSMLGLILGLLCMLFLFFHYLAAWNVGGRRSSLHWRALNLIERRLEEGQVVQVQYAIQAYRQSVNECGYDDALYQMLTVLQQSDWSYDEERN